MVAHGDGAALDAVDHLADAAELRVGEHLDFDAAAGALLDKLRYLVGVERLRCVGDPDVGIAQLDLRLGAAACQRQQRKCRGGGQNRPSIEHGRLSRVGGLWWADWLQSLASSAIEHLDDRGGIGFGVAEMDQQPIEVERLAGHRHRRLHLAGENADHLEILEQLA